MNDTQKFFVRCVGAGIKGESVLAVPQNLDYKQLYKLCIEHSMSVVVFKALEQVKANLMPNFVNALEYSAKRHVVLDVQSNHDVQTLLTAFEENGIKHMPLKGYHIKKLYPSTDMRYTSDCDVLIDVAQLKRIRELVNELGLQTKRQDEHHDVVYFPQTKSIIELHKTLFVGKLDEYFGTFERATLKEGSKYFYRLSHEDFYASILAHSAYHFAKNAGVGIRHVADVYLYKKAYGLDYDYLDKELEKCNLLQFKNRFESLADYFFSNAEPDEFTLALAEHVISSSVLANDGKKVASDVVALGQSASGKRAKKRTFWRTLFPKKEQMQFSYPVLKKAVWLLPIFYVIRWVQVLFTRPDRLNKLKQINKASSEDLASMQALRSGLGITEI